MSGRMRRSTVVLAVVAAALGLLSPVPAGAVTAPEQAAPAPAAIETGPVQDPVEVDRYWTPDRMRRATPVAADDRPQPSGTTAPQDVGKGKEWTGPADRLPASSIGKLFYTGTDGADYVGSGVVVDSPSRNIVLTAGSMLYDKRTSRPEGWNRSFFFVPGYKDGTGPFGGWASATSFVPSQYITGNPHSVVNRWNVGALVMATNGQGQHVEDLTGAQHVRLDGDYTGPAKVFGYPEHDAYSGERLVACDGPATYIGSDYLRMPCDLRDGAVGGPMIAGLDPSTGVGTVITVNDYVLGDGVVEGPYFAEQIAEMYKMAGRLGPLDAFVPVGGRGNLTTGIQIQNLDTSRDASVNVDWVDNPGDRPAKRAPKTVPKGGSITVFDEDPDGFSGGVRVVPNGISASSVKVTANHLDLAKGTSSGAGGFTTLDGAQRVLLPLLMKNHYGTSTWVAVQNLEPESVTVTPHYRSADGSVRDPGPFAIQPGETHFINQAADPGITDTVLSGELTATGDIAATVIEDSAASMLEYRGFPVTAAATELALPLLMGNNYGGFTGIQVQSLDLVNPVDVDLDYTANTATPADGQPAPCRFTNGSAVPDAHTYTIPKGASVTVLQRGNPGDDPQFRGCRYIGSGTLRARSPIVAIVNQVLGTSASAYEAIPTATTGPKLELPLIQGNNDKSYSGIQIQNLNVFGAETVTVTYGRNDAGGTNRCPVPAAHDVTVPPDGSLTLLYGNHGSAQSWSRSCAYVGPVTLRAKDGGRITALVNQAINNGTSDGLSTYTAG